MISRSARLSPWRVKSALSGLDWAMRAADVASDES